jgi:hypothetical protein
METEEFVHCSECNVHVTDFIEIGNAILSLPCKAATKRQHMMQPGYSLRRFVASCDTELRHRTGETEDTTNRLNIIGVRDEVRTKGLQNMK